MYDFFMLLPKILPCKKCQNHFQENLNQFPINNYLDSREKLVFWLFTIHNQVNKLLGKSEYSYETFVKKLNCLEEGNTHFYCTYNKFYIILGIITIAIMFYYKDSVKQFFFKMYDKIYFKYKYSIT